MRDRTKKNILASTAFAIALGAAAPAIATTCVETDFDGDGLQLLVLRTCEPVDAFFVMAPSCRVPPPGKCGRLGMIEMELKDERRISR